MFKKLRNNFLILHITIITFVMLTAFTLTYLTIYNNIQSENRKSLSGGMTVQGISLQRAEPVIEVTESVAAAVAAAITTDGTTTMYMTSPLDLRSFNIEVDTSGQITSIDTFFEMPDEAYKKAAELAWDKKKNYSVISVEGKEWMYNIEPVSIFPVSGKAGDVYIDVAEDKYNIMFLDVTDSNKTLQTLFLTFLIVTLIMLVVITAISFYFASRSIKPIAETWEKQKQFIVDASHELKTPLTIIKSNYGALLANKEETIESQIKWFDYINAGTERMTKLINDLLALAAIDNINLKTQNIIFDISNTIKDVVLSMEARAAAKDICLSSSIKPDIMINSDPEEIAQVVTILLDNAIKYTDSNGRIDVLLAKSKHHITCSVKNSGKGIEEDDLSKIFDRFYRADASRNSESGGYGLGLSIAKAIIEKSGGKLYAKSIPNESVTFAFTLKI